MKTKILFVVLMLAAAAVSIRMNLKRERLDSLMLENVEALATGEVSPTECPGGRHLCAWIHDPLGSTTYYDENGPDDI